MSADLTCPYCSWAHTHDDSPARIDQSAFTTLWEHIQAAHYRESTSLRLMRTDARRTSLADHVRIHADPH